MPSRTSRRSCRSPALVVLASLVALALALFGCGEESGSAADAEPASESPARATVAQLLEDPDAFAAAPVLVPGVARRIGDLGFLLADEGRVVFVGAPASELDRLTAGEQITVRGELSELDETRAETIADALDGQPEALEPPFDAWRESVGPDKPLLNLRVLMGADGRPLTGAGAPGANRDLPPGRSPASVVADVERLAGRKIRVTGEVDVLTRRILTLGEEDLYVAAAKPWPRGRLAAGERITAVGRLEVLDAEALTDRLGGPSLLPSQFQGFDRRPVLLAERVELAGSG